MSRKGVIYNVFKVVMSLYLLLLANQGLVLPIAVHTIAKKVARS